MKYANRNAVPKAQVQRARAMRAQLIEPERELWRALRQRPPIEGSHFRRQMPIGPYIADFCCQGAKLVIEVDGHRHGTDEGVAFDANRTALIEAQGFRVLRFSNLDVICSLESVLDTIFAALPERTPTPGPSIQGGGEERRLNG